MLAHGYVEDKYGRRYHVPRERAYKAVNAVIQGTAATVLKRALVRLEFELGMIREEMDAVDPLNPPLVPPGMVLNVHDEVAVECDDRMAPNVPNRCAKIMECHDFSLPLTVDISWAPDSWADKRSPEEFDG